MKTPALLLFAMLLVSCASPDAPASETPVNLTTAAPTQAEATVARTPTPTLTVTNTFVPTPTVQGRATLEALLTEIPGAMPEPTRSGGLAEPSSFDFYPVEGETVESLKAEVAKLLATLAKKTGPDLPAGLEAEIRALMLPAGSLDADFVDGPCNVDDTVRFLTPDLSPSFGPPYSLWLEGLDAQSIVWNSLGDTGLTEPAVTVTYDGRRDVLYAAIGVNVPTAHLMVFTYPKETMEQDDREIRGAVYFILVDGQWRIALTSVGCQYKIQ